MTMKLCFATLAMAATILSAGCASKVASDPCGKLENLKLENARVTSAKSVSGGKEFSFFGMFIGVPFFNVPASCRVAYEMTPTSDSLIKAEVWMPRDGWSGKFQGLGNGGLAGSVDKLSLINALQAGYAAASTDTGHEASNDDGRWALNHPEKIRDYGYRAVHETTVQAKKIIAAYYGSGPKFSYFSSCSNGGRQGMMEVQRYPEDYDAVLAGAPSIKPSDGLSAWAWIQQQLRKPGAYISEDKIPAIAAATLKACDANDGVKDGVIDNPPACKFNPDVLLCSGKETDDCLTAPQLQGLKAIYSGPRADLPGFEPGGEIGEMGAWVNWFTGSGPGKAAEIKFVQEFYRYLVSGDPSWTIDQFDLKSDEKKVHQKLDEYLTADSLDLSKFAARGGKLILYHGWNDAALSPSVTIKYYEDLRRHMGEAAVDNFVRLYMVPGLQHCFAGPGANTFGQLTPAGKTDPSESMGATMEAWREQGRVPSHVVATKYNYSGELTSLFKIEKEKALFTRKLCTYPQIARWDGKGDAKSESSFACVNP